MDAPLPVLDTERLRLRPLIDDDAPFILELVNEPGWRRFIGDRGIRTLDDALAYIHDGPQATYAAHGFGLYAVDLKADGAPIGLCGLLWRDGFDHPDLGFALLGRHEGFGYATEAARATVAFARDGLGLRRLLAVTKPDNAASGTVLTRCGFRFEALTDLSGIEEPQRLYVWSADGLD